MDFEQAYQLANAAVFAKTKRHLKDIEVLVLRGSWQGMRYHEIATNYGYTTEYLKCDVGPKLWKLLSEALGEKVSIVSLVAKEQVPETLQSLQRQLLLEISATGFTLPSIFIEYITQQLVERVCEEIISGKLVVLKSHSLLKPTANNFANYNQYRLILKPVLERLLSTLGSQNKLEVHLHQIHTKLQEESPQQIGYVNSNILNLLCQLNHCARKKCNLL